MIYVVGSGPAGTACAWALVERGLEVTMLDAGLDLEPERRAALHELQRTEFEAWPAKALDRLKGPAPGALGGVPLKNVYGSDYPYREVERLTPFANQGSATRPTLARGGFSSVWGAAILPYLADDLGGDWPIGVEDLAPHYRAVASLLDPSAVVDDLARRLPLYLEGPEALEPSQQARELMADIDRNREPLRAAGFHCGYARLAVRSRPKGEQPGCVYCGLCLDGCPHELIYNSTTTITQLMQRPNFHYLPDLVVQRVSESGDGVRITARSLSEGGTQRFDGERLYLAAGVLSTTRILLESLEAWDRPLILKDSQYFLLPWIRRKGVSPAGRARLHTLAQLFIELQRPEEGERSVHLQVYTYNEPTRRVMLEKLGFAAGLAGAFTEPVLARMLLIQGYLHSDRSPSITVALHRGEGGEPSRLSLEGCPNPETKPAIRRVVSALWKHRRAFGAYPASPFLYVAPPGRGFHSGGTFPMRSEPGPFECDLLGRPHGFSAVHVVDATAFPSIPATTITLSVMANAHRIAAVHGEL
jgi:choline dehydrogenase-like flavoprotein